MVAILKRSCVSRVYVFKRRAQVFGAVLDFFVDGLYFMVMENGVWAVDCEGKCLIFDSTELVKID